MSGAALRESIDAEAAAWVARLQGDVRDTGTDAALKAWLDADPANEAAFERATEVWAMIPGAALCREAEAKAGARAEARVVPMPRRRVMPLPQLALAASLLLVVGIGALLWLLEAPSYSTSVGEQKVATLEDGSRIALNTDSRLEVHYGAAERRVELERGEAMFEVAHNAARPFIVVAGTTRVRAVGTSFIVRREGDTVVVTLIQGKVAVTDSRAEAAAMPQATTAAPAMMIAGQRLTTEAGGLIERDVQSAEAATAWRRGQAVFSDTPLSQAVAELNRYGGPRIAIDDPALGALPVSGVFATNDTEEFAQAVAALHGLRAQKTGETLHIVR
ncbi:FecR family protein [Sphingomonas sp.]|uniref:FecR family protein n=1 Tax=Sphingomonas sp. TaxID=28214 RepID=UPI001B07C9CE|nr:FecR family protein [Sphingomonas sp.]MBO9711629.1 FecR family protein [Sphingomonas sp.]